jgi:hypothetical protein
MTKPIPYSSRLRLALVAMVLPLAPLMAPAQSAGIASGLQAYWHFDSNSFEDSVNDFDGTEMGSEPIAFINGKEGFGRAIKLNGEDQYVEVTGGEPDDLAFAGGSVSIAGWFKVDAFDTAWQGMVAQGEGTSWRVARRGEEGGIAYAGGLTDTPTGSDVNDGNWHHFVAISDAEGVNFGTALYVDGVQDAMIEGAAVLAANGLRVQIGANPGAASREWEGDLDDIAIWNRVLSEAEIAQLYNNGTGRPLRDLLGAAMIDTDNDGMPNEWETLYGFNPNDPADAALDCDNDGATNLAEYLAGTDPCDTTPPTLLSAAATASFNSVVLTFSEDLDPTTATAVANYSISPSLAVTAAAHNGRTVTLTTAAQTPGATAYTVTVTGVLDTSKNAIPANTTATFYSYLLLKDGVLKLSFWGGITGTPVENLQNDPRYPDSPDWTGAVFSFNSRDILPTDSNENYGATIEGFITPTQSGMYHFFLRSDDASRLEISTDASPANLVWQAEEYGCCAAFLEPGDAAKPTVTTAEPISMVANQRYFIRVTYKEGGGGDFAQVAWRREGDTTPAGSLLPIPGQFLSAEVDLPAPPDGAFVTQTPAPNARGVIPTTGVVVSHRDGKTVWTAENTSLRFNGTAVTSTFTKAGNLATLTYQPPSILPSGSTNTVTLSYLDAGGNPATLEWSFVAAEYQGPILDKVMGAPAILLGTAAQTADQGGRTGAAGDYAYDSGSAGSGLVPDASFLNAATADDTLSVAFFQKLRSVRASSSFWANSPTSNNATRGYQAHVPWSDSTIYFDTSGCCDAEIQRISSNIENFAGYTGDATWWQEWRHFVFVKDGLEKHIYINGELFHSGGGEAPLKTDFTNLVLGGGSGIADNRMDGMLDDFAIYNGALTAAQAASLAGGAAPGSVTGLVAHWDFNDASAPATVTLTAVRSGANITVTSEPATLPAGWVLQTAPSITGPWTTQAGATTPFTVTVGAGDAFLRATRP